MNYNMYSNNTNDQIDPNYIYPKPYIDPTMYMNPYMMNGTQNLGYQINPGMIGYTTYSNPYAENPSNPDLSQMNSDAVYPTIEDYSYPDIDKFSPNIPNMNIPNTNPMQCMPNMMYPGMLPGMCIMPNMMYPGMLPGMYMMPNMMYPGMFSSIPQINMEEFDEEEM